MKNYYLIPIAFPNYLTGTIIFDYLSQSWRYFSTRKRNFRDDSFWVAGFQNKAIFDDFTTYTHFFSALALHSRKIQLFLQFS